MPCRSVSRSIMERTASRAACIKIRPDPGGDVVALRVEMPGDGARGPEARERRAAVCSIRSNFKATRMGLSMAVPQTSPSPCAACVSPTEKSAPATSMGRNSSVPCAMSRTSMLPPDAARWNDAVLPGLGGRDPDRAGEGLQRHLAPAAEQRRRERLGIVSPDVQRGLLELLGQQAEPRDVRRPAPSGRLESTTTSP